MVQKLHTDCRNLLRLLNFRSLAALGERYVGRIRNRVGQ
jgi:hypothetical protein